MKVNTEPLETHEIQLTVELEPQRVDKAMKAVARQLSRKANIPGFRKGKAPYWRIAQAFGEPYLLEAALEDLGDKVYKDALEESDIEPYGPGTLEKIETDPVVLTFRVPLPPEVTLGDYRAIRLPFDEPETADEEIAEALENLRQNRAVTETVERPADWGDQVTLDIFGELLPEGQEALDEEAPASDENVLIDEEAFDLPLDAEKDLLPGFAAELVGMEALEEKEFYLDIPEDFENEDLQGRRVFFELECLEVASRKLPTLNDTFAAEVSDGEHESLLELRMEIRKQLQDHALHEAQVPYFDEIMDIMLDEAELAYPPMMVDDAVEDELNRMDADLRRRGLGLDDYLRLQGKTREQMGEEIREAVETNLQRGLILGEVAEEEELEVDKEAVDAKIGELFGENVNLDALDAEFRASVRRRILTEQVVDRLIAIARGEDPPKGPVPKAKLAEKVTSEHVATLDGLRDEMETAEEETEEDRSKLFPGERVEGGIVRID